MKFATGKLLLGLFVLNGFSATLATAQWAERNDSNQSANGAGKETRVALASNSGPPGSVVVVPIYFTPAPSAKIGRLQLKVNYVSESAKFEKFAPGPTAAVPNVELRSEVQKGKNEKGLETTKLTIVATISSAPAAPKGIPGGILGYLNLRIINEAPPAIISLHTAAEATELDSNSPVENLQATDAQLEISWVDAPPSLTCFFFSH